MTAEEEARYRRCDCTRCGAALDDVRCAEGLELCAHCQELADRRVLTALNEYLIEQVTP